MKSIHFNKSLPLTYLVANSAPYCLVHQISWAVSLQMTSTQNQEEHKAVVKGKQEGRERKRTEEWWHKREKEGENMIYTI